MKLIAPDYYADFHCIADRCRHSCCIGWEIDIDTETMKQYRSVPGPFGKRLQDAVFEDEAGAHFRLDSRERCPMLNERGLCDLIINLGEGMLCQICADHPRFRNFFTGRTEIGLGLCCEAAAQLILAREKPVTFLPLEDDGKSTPLPDEEADLLETRAGLITLLQNRTLPLEVRLHKVLAAVSHPLPENVRWAEVYRSLERLDSAWDEALDKLEHTDITAAPIPPALSLPLEQFAVYMMWRHLPGALDDGDIPGRAAFCVLSVLLLAALCSQTADCSLNHLLEWARMYSAEIEYSDENMEALLDALWT